MHPVRIPHEQVNDESVLLVDWLAPDGAEVKAGQPVAVIETSKATTQVEAPQAGFLRHGAVKGKEMPVGAIFCHIAASATEALPSAAPAAGAPAETAPAKSDGAAGATRFSRGALALMTQHGLSEASFQGRGLVRERDVLDFLGPKAGATAAPAESAPGPSAKAAPIPATGVATRAEDLPRAKRVEAKYLASGRDHTLASVVSVVCPTAGLQAAVNQRPDLGGNASALIVFETARLLRKYPAFNAYHDSGKIQYYEQVNIGVAVDGGRGLKVPVIFDADKKSITDIAHEMEDMVLAYVNDEIPVASLAGGTFTVTDLSGEDVLMFHPLINQGQAAILGVGAAHRLPDSRHGFFNLILGFDHQLAEGRLAAKFLKDLRDRVMSYEEALNPGGAAKSLTCARCQRGAAELAETNTPLLQEVRADGARTLICKSCLLEAA